MHEHVPLNHAPVIEQDLYRLAGAMQELSRRDICGGEEFSVKPFFTHNLRYGDHFYAGLKVWPCDGHSLRRAGTEWGHRNHITLFYLTSVRSRLFCNKKVTDRLKAILHDELEFIRCPFFSDPGEFRARVAFGTPENRDGIVYSAITRTSDPRLCLVQVIGRILRNVFMFCMDHGYVPLDCDMQTVTLHMQFHPGRGHRALKDCFEAWRSAAAVLQGMRAAAVPAPILLAVPPPPPARPAP